MIGTLCGGGRAFPSGKMFGMFQGRDRALSSPAAGSGIYRRIVRDIVPAGRWGVQLELGASASPFEDRGHRVIGIGNNCSGSGHCSGLASGHTGVFTRIFPGLLPAPRRNPVPGELTRTIVRLPDGPGHGPGEDPPVTRLNKKIYLRG